MTPSDTRARLAAGLDKHTSLWAGDITTTLDALTPLVDTLIAEAVAAQEARRCDWKEDEDGNWTTACDEMHIFNDGDPKDNKHQFCPYCGAALYFEKFTEAPDGV